MILQLYLHFPFCKRKCFYCDFCSAPQSEEIVSAYCAALRSEIAMMAKRYPHARVSTVFLGGGTPSVVAAEEMAGVIEELKRRFAFQPDAEFTTEANPGTLTPAWLDMAAGHGVNRLSLGLQASQERLLRRIGRIHTFAETEAAVKMAREAGIRNLSLDVMFGLPGQTLRDYLETLEGARALCAQHLSAYSLILEENTALFDAVSQGRCVLPDDDETAEMYEQGAAWMERAGYAQYEVSNFARSGFECRHNIGYWQGAWYLGMGLAAHSMLPPSQEEAERGAVRVRRANTEDIHAYIKAIRAGESPQAQSELIQAQEAMFESMMLGLRMTRGIGEAEFEMRHGVALVRRYGEALEGLVRDGLGKWHGDGAGERRFSLTPRGLEMQNEVLLRLM